MNELTYASATTLAQLIRQRQISATEVMHAYLAQIERVNPAINAIVQLDSAAALAAATAADQTIATGVALGPLHGVPFTVKDWIDAQGFPCTGGELQYRQRMPTADATSVARLRRAGAILLGKTNVVIENDVYGRTNNPYNLAYSPTGSSSGEAAIIAAGGSAFGLGSDSGGSIRQPAHACGIAGLKPTTGRIPLTGHFPFISALNDPRTTIGPMARFVEDLALLLPIIAGPDDTDYSALPVPLADWRAVDLRSLRVSFYTDHPNANPSAETVAICRAVAASLTDHCASVEERLPPRIEEALPLTIGYWRRPESTSAGQWVPDNTAQLSSEEVEQHLFEWDRFRRSMHHFLRETDIIITPVADLPAQPHGSDSGGIPYTLPYSLTGWPAVVVRAGTSADGMPIGVQVVAGPWRDHQALAVAAVIESAFGGWQPPHV
ncbi:MAG: amidase [Roseiflexaceae bacterium]